MCFAAAALHRWCRVFVTPTNSGPCTCGGAGGVAVAGVLVTDAQLYDLIGENIKQAEVGANGRRFSANNSRSRQSHMGY